MDGPGLVSIAVGVDVHLPQFDVEAWLQLAVLIGTLILCGVASAAETALTSVSRIKLKNLVEEGDPRAIQIEKLLSEPNTFLSTILVVNSVAVIVASSMATVLALRFSETWGEVLVPRIDMITLASDITVTEAVDLALQGGFSRIPVYEAEVGVDEIIGVLYTKDLLKQLRDDHDSVQIRALVRPAYFVPETKKLDDLLREIRQNRVHMVIVVDDYGSVASLVTIEDLVEEIIGDIK